MRSGHFFRFASKVHPATKAPYMSIIIQSVIAIIMVLSGTFDQILTFMGFSLGIFPIIAVTGVFKLRSSGKSKIKMAGYPFVPGLFIFIAIVILLLAFFERPVESSIAIGTVIVGIPAFYLFSGAAKK